MADLANTVTLITGAASGVGRASALAFAAAGSSVALVDIDEDGLEKTAAAVHEVSAGIDIELIIADVTDLAAIERAVDQTAIRFGRLDAALNNADVAGPSLALDQYPPEDFMRILQVVLVGVWHAMRAEVGQMRAQGSGAIVNMSSMLGSGAMPDNGPHEAAKQAVNGLTRTAAQELAGVGIRVNGLARVAEPDDIAAAAVWLCSPSASDVTGTVLVADGGWLAR